MCLLSAEAAPSLGSSGALAEEAGTPALNVRIILASTGKSFSTKYAMIV